jgi:hypothetical protein
MDRLTYACKLELITLIKLNKINKIIGCSSSSLLEHVVATVVTKFIFVCSEGTGEVFGF